MKTKAFSLAVGTLLLFAGGALAATVTDNLNVRSGPGFGYSVIGWVRAGSDIRVLSCDASWCRVAWNATTGYASREFISSGSSPAYAASPAAGVVTPSYGYGYGFPGYGYGGWRPFGGWPANRYFWYR
jgi:uncharacterized protein YraI